MSQDRKTTKINLHTAVSILRKHLKEGRVTENQRHLVEDFINRLEKSHGSLQLIADDQKVPSPSDPYAAYITGTELEKIPAVDTPVPISHTSRTSSSVPAAEYVEEKRPRRKTLYLLAPAIIALAIGIAFNAFRKDHVFAWQSPDQMHFQETPTAPRHLTDPRPTSRLTAPVIQTDKPLESLPKQTATVETVPEPDKIFLYRYYVSAGRLRHDQNRLSAIAERFGCVTEELRIYNKNLFPSADEEFLQKAGYLWIPGDACSYNARTHLHADYVLSYRVSADEGPIALGALRRRFGCQKEQLTAYFRKETPGINAEAIPPGTRVALPSTLCSALNP